MIDETSARQRLRQRLRLRLKLAEAERRQAITRQRCNEAKPASTPERFSRASGPIEYKGMPVRVERKADGMWRASWSDARYAKWGSSADQARRNLTAALAESGA